MDAELGNVIRVKRSLKNGIEVAAGKFVVAWIILFVTLRVLNWAFDLHWFGPEQSNTAWYDDPRECRAFPVQCARDKQDDQLEEWRSGG